VNTYNIFIDLFIYIFKEVGTIFHNYNKLYVHWYTVLVDTMILALLWYSLKTSYFILVLYHRIKVIPTGSIINTHILILGTYITIYNRIQQLIIITINYILYSSSKLHLFFFIYHTHFPIYVGLFFK